MLADSHAERAVLGGLLVRPEAFAEVNDVCTPDDWHDPNLRAVAAALWSLLGRGAEVDVSSIASELQAAGALQRVGGVGAVLELSNDGVSSHALPRHARRVRDVSAARRLQMVAQDVRNAGDEALSDPSAWVERQAMRLAEASQLQREDGARKIRDLFEPAIRRLQRRKLGEERGIPYGYPDLDLVTSGMSPGEYVVIAARPSCGKSALATNIAINVAKQRIPVRVHSLEMSAGQLIDRVFSQEGHVGHGNVRSGRITEMDSQGIMSACARLQDAPIWIDDTRGLTCNELVSRCRQWRRDPKAGGSHANALIIVDYLQLVRPTKGSRSREQEVAEVSGSLQALAGQTGCAVIVLAQLSRAVEQRGKSAKPMLSDLRESGAIEQDADTVIFVHRPDRNGEDVAPGTTSLVIAKARNGETGEVPLHFVGRLVSFQSVERRRQDPR